MDLAALKNFDVKEFFDKLKSGGFSDKKILMKFAIGFGAIVVFLIIYYSFVSPVVEEQKKQINIMNDNKAKIIQFNQNIGSLKATIKKLEPEYQKNSKLFHSKIEVEDLYQNISNFAQSNGLSIVNLKKEIQWECRVSQPPQTTQQQQIQQMQNQYIIKFPLSTR